MRRPNIAPHLDRGNIAKLNETVSFYDFERSFDRYSSGEKSSLFLHETTLNNTLRNRSKNTSGGAKSDSSFLLERSSFFSDEKDSLPISALITSSSPFSKPIFTEGHYKSMSFDGDAGQSQAFDEDYLDSKRLDWIFNSTEISLHNNSSGYQVGFIMKDQKKNGIQPKFLQSINLLSF